MHHKEPLFFEDVEVGQEIPKFTRKTGIMEFNRFAAANEEFVPFHMEDEPAKPFGVDRAFGMGNLRFEYLHGMLMSWIGRDGWIKNVGCQYRGYNLKDQTLTCWGKVTKKYEENGMHLIDLEVGVNTENGENQAPGFATVALPARHSH
jgi:acyl dehydratase